MCITIMTASKKSIGELKLHYLKHNYSHLAAQGSTAWLTGRCTKFGGSEIYRITSNSKSCREKLINRKRVPGSEKPNIYCWWGIIFEEIAKEHLSHFGKLSIHEFGSVPSPRLPMAYSPDGLFVSPTDNDLWLLEIKCPMLRAVNAHTSVKEEYIKQVQSGMSILPINKTLFVQFKFRRCSFDQLNKKSQYYKGFHFETKRYEKQDELYYGALYWDEPNAISEGFLEKKPSKTFTSYANPTFVHEIEGSYNFGVVCYFKCFFVLNTIIKKDPNFEANIQSKLWRGYEELLEDKKKYPPVAYTRQK